MATPTEPMATYEELLAVPNRLLAEIINGRLSALPQPAPRHTRTNSSLGGELVGPFDAIEWPLSMLWVD